MKINLRGVVIQQSGIHLSSNKFSFATAGFPRIAPIAFFKLHAVCNVVAYAEETPPDISDKANGLEVLSISRVQARIDELSSSKDSPAAVRDNALELLHGALGRLKAARASTESGLKFKEALHTGTAAIAKIQSELKALAEPTASNNTPPNPTELAELQQRLTQGQAQVASLHDPLNEVDDLIRSSAQRYAAIRNELAEEKKKLEELNLARQTIPPLDESPVIEKARQELTIARKGASTAQIGMLEQEFLSLPIRRRLLSVQRDLAAAQLADWKRNSPASNAPSAKQFYVRHKPV
jgi:chromosome segregation ATPase